MNIEKYRDLLPELLGSKVRRDFQEYITRKDASFEKSVFTLYKNLESGDNLIEELGQLIIQDEKDEVKSFGQVIAENAINFYNSNYHELSTEDAKRVQKYISSNWKSFLR